MYMDEMEKKGFTREQAKASVNLWIELMNENLASKNDIKDLLHKMDKEFLTVRHDMKEESQAVRHDMKDLESRLTIKLGGLMATAIGLIALIQKL
jgi:hypothetical protein